MNYAFKKTTNDLRIRILLIYSLMKKNKKHQNTGKQEQGVLYVPTFIYSVNYAE